MGLKCSLLGHAFDERDVVRERESTGGQVVTVAKEIERCSRCGATRVVSTNKEVVSASNATADGGLDTGPSLRTPGGDAGPDQPVEGATGGPDGPTGPGGGPESGPEATARAAGPEGGDSFPAAEAMGGSEGPAGGRDAPDGPGDEFAGSGFESPAGPDTPSVETSLDPDAGEAPVPEDDPTADPGEEPDPTEEDAEILGDIAASDRAPGRWPGEEAADPWEPTPLDAGDDGEAGGDGPVADDGDEGTDDTPEDATADTDAGTGAASTDSGPDADPDAGTGAGDAGPTEEDAEILGAGDGRTGGSGGTPNTVAEPAPEVDDTPEPAATASFTVPDGAYRCPECGHRIDADSSHRIGDACPDCFQGYLEDDD